MCTTFEKEFWSGCESHTFIIMQGKGRKWYLYQNYIYLHWKNSNKRLYMITCTCFCLLSNGSSACSLPFLSVIPFMTAQDVPFAQPTFVQAQIYQKINKNYKRLFFNINFSPWKLHHHSIDSFDPSDKCLFCNWGRKVWKANFDLFVDRFVLNVLFS